jgi:GNAT superfamily N-acetyltransferase
MQSKEITATGRRFSVMRDGVELGHAYVYFLHNDLHQAPFALLEDVQVHPNYQGQGIGNELVRAVIEHAKSAGAYKLIATSRNDGTRANVHAWYERVGFVAYGTEFRMNF